MFFKISVIHCQPVFFTVGAFIGAKPENLEVEEATEANYWKQGAHVIFFF